MILLMRNSATMEDTQRQKKRPNFVSLDFGDGGEEQTKFEAKRLVNLCHFGL